MEIHNKEKISIFFTSESISTIKMFGSFARVVNCLLTILKNDKELQTKLQIELQKFEEN